MSNEGFFQREEIDMGASQNEGQLIPDHAGINLRRQSQDNSKYHTGAVYHGVSGTQVPVTNNAGSIEKTRNKYGLVNRGKTYTMGNDGDEDVVGDAPLFDDFSLNVPTDEAIEKEASQPQNLPESTDQPLDMKFDELDDLDQLVSQINTAKEETPRYIQDLQPAERLPTPTVPDPISFTTVKMAGSFGTFKGKFLDVMETEDLIVLQYPLDKDAYSPPSSSDVFTLSFNNTSHEVIYLGIEFELEKYGIGIQVMVKSNSA
jgi:hypothetical protein